MDGYGERFECPNCSGGVFFMEDGQLVDSCTDAGPARVAGAKAAKHPSME
jgi:hypothetical protein